MKIFGTASIDNITRTLVTALAASLLVMFPGGPTQMAYAASADCTAEGLAVGDGTPNNPMQVSNATEFAAITECVQANPGKDLTYQIVSNIDLSVLGQIDPFPIFEGSLIGGNHFVSGFSISNSVGDDSALFAMASGSATVSNLLVTGEVENTATIGGNLGLLFAKVEGSLTALNVGLAGTISETVAGATVNAGLLAGKVDFFTVLDGVEVTQASIRANAAYVGGMVGQVTDLELRRSAATVLEIDSSGVSVGYYGGMVGYAGTITGLVDTVYVEDLNLEAYSGHAGGIFGKVNNSNLEIHDAEIHGSSISISDGAVGGVAGTVEMSVEADDAWIESTVISSGGNRIGGFFGYVGGSLRGAQLQVDTVQINVAASSDYVGGVAGAVFEYATFDDVFVENLSVPTMDSYFGGAVGAFFTGGIEIAGMTVSSISVNANGGYVGGVVGSQDDHFTASFITLMDSRIFGGGNFVAGHVGLISNGGYTVDNANQFGVNIESSTGGSVGGFVGNVQLDAALSNVDIFEQVVIGSGQFVAGAVGFVSSGGVRVSSYSSDLSLIANQSSGTNTAGIVGGVDGAAEFLNISLVGMSIDAAGSFTSFGIGHVPDGQLIATNVFIADSVISASGGLNYMGALAGALNSGADIEGITLRDVELRADGAFTGGLIGGAGSSHVSAHRISLTNLTISSEAGDSYMAGILGAGESVSFSEVVVDAASIRNILGTWTGGLIGQTPSGQDFTAIEIDGLVVAGHTHVGGISGGVGSANPAKFIDISLSNVVVEGSDVRAGGLIGGMSSGLISQVRGADITVSADDYVGGLVGTAFQDIEFDDIELSNVSVSAVTDYAGGIGGAMYGEISMSGLALKYTTVTAKSYVAGVFGSTYDVVTASNVTLEFTALNSSATANEGRVGGVVGFATSAMVTLDRLNLTMLFVDTQTSNVGGVVGWSTNGLSISNFVIQNATITANRYAGGVIGSSNTVIRADKGYLMGISIDATLGDVGGFAGFTVQDDTRISRLGMYNVSINAGGTNAAGLIAYSTVGTVLTDVDLINVEINSTGDDAGGLFGFSVGMVTVSRAVLSDLSVNGDNSIGGLIGYSIYGLTLDQVLLSDVASTGSSNVGDFIGRLSGNDHLLVSTQSYIVYVQSSSSAIANIAGSTGSASLPVEISASEALDISTFIGWDFDTYFGLRCSETPATVGLRAVTDGLFAVCIAPSPSNPSQVAPVTFVYQGPNFSSISPKVIWSASNITLIGNKLDLVTRISVDGIDLKFTVISSTQIELVIPAGLSLGKKDLKVEHSMGSLLVGSAFEVVAPPVVLLPKVTVTTFNGRVWIYFKNVSGKALVVKIGGKWHRVPNNGTEVVSFTRKSVKGKTVKVSAYIAGVKVATNSVRVR